MAVTIQKWGNSHAVRLPKSVIEQAGLVAGSEVEVRVEGDTVVIHPAKRRRRIPVRELVRGMTPAKNRFPDVRDTGPVGREIL